MKKFKLFNILLVLVMFFVVPTVYAHNVELDPNDVISIPLDSKGQIASSTKIVIDESFGEYDLYYQYVKMNSTDFEQYMEIHEQELEYEAENLPDKSATEEEKSEYNSTMLEYQASMKALRPQFVEDNWLASTDGTVKFKTSDGTTAKEGDPYVLWIKLTKKNIDEDPIYDEQIILYSIPTTTGDNINNAQTSDNILVVGLLAVVAMGLMVVSYKKSRA